MISRRRDAPKLYSQHQYKHTYSISSGKSQLNMFPSSNAAFKAQDTAVDVSNDEASAPASNLNGSSTVPSQNGPGGSLPRPSPLAVLVARIHRMQTVINPHVVQTVLWVAFAGLAAFGVYVFRGAERAVEFVTAYIVEYSLSVDNLFVFMVIFQYFKVSNVAQETALNWGIIGAMVLRGFMIVLGKALVERFEWISVFFALLLLYSAVKLLFEDDDDEEDLDNNRIVRFAKRLLPVTDRYHGERFFVFDADDRLLATPLFVVLISVELSDVVFALDSVPAVLGISSDTLVIYSSNILAVMGLRSLFFVISDAIKNLRFLQQSLAIVLGFIGLKMIGGVLGYHIPVLLSLGVVCGTLSVGVLLSVLFPKPESTEDGEDDEAPLSSQVSAEGTTV